MTTNRKRIIKPKSPGLKRRRPTHFHHHNGTGYAVSGRVWIEKNGELYIGWGRTLLLENIDRLGSIAAAARAMKLGYRNAWLWIEAMNRLSQVPLVEKRTGGAGGGHAQLTEAGRRAVNEYRELRTRFQGFLKHAR